MKFKTPIDILKESFEGTYDEIYEDREPLDREEPDDPIAEHDEREWQIAIDKRIE